MQFALMCQLFMDDTTVTFQSVALQLLVSSVLRLYVMAILLWLLAGKNPVAVALLDRFPVCLFTIIG